MPPTVHTAWLALAQRTAWVQYIKLNPRAQQLLLPTPIRQAATETVLGSIDSQIGLSKAFIAEAIAWSSVTHFSALPLAFIDSAERWN